MIAIAEAARNGLLHKKHFPNNLLAGIIVGIIALPLAMAFAIASGAKPEQGIYTAIVAGLATSLFGGSRTQISGPTGAFIVILSGITAKYGIVGLQVATLMAGCMLVAMGLARMGGVIKYIPDPVIIGFTTGIGVIIWVGQWKDFFGLTLAGTSDHFHEKLWQLLTTLPQEQHSLGLLMVEALLALEGCTCVSLGTQTPLNDIAQAARAHRADVVALSFSNVHKPALVQASLRELRAQLPPATALWLGGACTALYQRPLAGVSAVAQLPALQPLVAQWRRGP